jgi:hypothetical protein
MSFYNSEQDIQSKRPGGGRGAWTVVLSKGDAMSDSTASGQWRQEKVTRARRWFDTVGIDVREWDDGEVVSFYDWLDRLVYTEMLSKGVPMTQENFEKVLWRAIRMRRAASAGGAK